jgi:uncharacterized protein DUF6158
VPKQKMGVAPKNLTDAALKRELRHLWRTREETIRSGSSAAIGTHTRRMLELEDEYIDRFPNETEPAPSRTRRGSRAMSGQSPGRRIKDR